MAAKDRTLSAGDRERLALLDRPERHLGGKIRRRLMQIDTVLLHAGDCIGSGKFQELLEDALELAQVLGELVFCARIAETIDARTEHGDRRPHLMGGIGDEIALRLEARFQPIERAINRADQRPNFGRRAAKAEVLIWLRRTDAIRLA